METSPSTLNLGISEESLAILTSEIESRIIKSIKEDPSKFLPSADAPRDIKFFTTEEVAEKLRVSPVKIRNLCHEGKLGFTRPGGRNIMITEDQYEEYLQTLLNNQND